MVCPQDDGIVGRPVSTWLPVVLINTVAKLVIVSAGKASRLLVGFHHEVWFLSLRPAPVLRRSRRIERRRFLKKIDAFVRLCDFHDEPGIIPLAK